MFGKIGFLLGAALLLVTSCSSGKDISCEPRLERTDNLPAVDTSSDRLPIPGLEQPSKLVAHTAPDSSFVFFYGRYLFGAHALQHYGGQNVSGDEHRAVFSPDWKNGLDGLAYTVYRFDMANFKGDGNFILEWEGDAPSSDNLYLGLGNFTTDSWDWYSPDEQGGLAIADLTPYQDPADVEFTEQRFLLLAVALTGNQPASLVSVIIGERIIVEGTDMSMLCTAVIDYEVEKQLADFDSRNPVSQDFVVEEEGTDDGYLIQVVSHTVDSYTHYGVVRFPPMNPGDTLPVVLLCHPGLGGTHTGGAEWYDQLTGPVVKDDFIIVMPSFRGESVFGFTGSFHSEGPASLYNRDVDDALALLDAVLTNYPEADPANVVGVGYSRGATVIQRAAQRDERIKAIVEFAGMTDEWNKEGQGYLYSITLNISDEPSVADNYRHGLWEYKNGLADIWATREMLLHNSSVYLAERFPPIQAHCGEQDSGLNQLLRLQEVLEATPGAVYECYTYENGTHNVYSLEGAGGRMVEFLLNYIE